MKQESDTSPLILSVLALPILFALLSGHPSESGTLDILNTATPTPDPLAIPVLPESPTQVDVGRNLYYYHCMPCHGDRGQGLTDEWRQVWVQDHQDCWARGCHAGLASDEGFPIPRLVPPVSGSTQTMASSQSADSLFDFLRQAHPPQRPGALSDDECWALTAFLLYENGRLVANGRVGPDATVRARPHTGNIVAISLGLLPIALLALWRKKRASSHR